MPLIQKFLIHKQNIQSQDRLLLSVHSDNKIRFFTEGQNLGARWLYSSVIVKNKWYHVVAIHEPGEFLTLYLNTVKTTGPICDTISNGSDTDFTIGGAVAGHLPFPGLINDVLFYNRRLTLKEITRHYQSYNLP